MLDPHMRILCVAVLQHRPEMQGQVKWRREEVVKRGKVHQNISEVDTIV